MVVEEIMKTEVITLKKDDTIETALQLLNEHHIRHIPIINEQKHILGIISDKDIRDACPSIFQKEEHCNELQNSVEKIMTKNVITVHPLDFVEEVSAIFYEKEIGCLPVTKEGKLVGIITEKDILYTLIQLTGALQPSSQIEVKVKNISGMLAKVVAIIAKRKVNINSVLVYPYSKSEEYKILVFRLQTMNPTSIINDLKNAGYTVLWPNLPGITL
ncbi:acetoin utilization protein AcuB [Vulcanibacillus modesticaldus]|uniref:Acetoin utilization protein AcuB n=1 Tax=Vulcanibacillus modesticaldus TaxID=337097 RepID=A0A1D2YRW8_9BACI|nr:acetoin utilization AcuB family protein [Vulcanibacillus modesticaldus]OEF95547.1 acetoin utilization protein AcuB [Vulcanibacillus modesticaldus]